MSIYGVNAPSELANHAPNYTRPESADEISARPHEGVIDLDEERALKAAAFVRSIRVSVGFLAYSLFIGALFIFVFVGLTSPPIEILELVSIDVIPITSAYILIQMVVLVRNVAKYVANWHYWRVSMKEAQNIADVESVVDGFTDLFRRYVKTRAIGYYGYVWSALGFFALVFVLSSEEMHQQRGWFLFEVAALSLSVIGNIIFAYKLSNDFKIGIVLVDFLGIIAYRSAHQMHTDKAQENTSSIAAKHRKKHFWLFY